MTFLQFFKYIGGYRTYARSAKKVLVTFTYPFQQSSVRMNNRSGDEEQGAPCIRRLLGRL